MQPIPLRNSEPSLPKTDERALLNEFKMAAQSLVDAYIKGDGQHSILTKHVAWFKELLD